MSKDLSTKTESKCHLRKGKECTHPYAGKFKDIDCPRDYQTCGLIGKAEREKALYRRANIRSSIK